MGSLVCGGIPTLPKRFWKILPGAGQKFPPIWGNGRTPLLPRHRNPIQKQLSMDGLDGQPYRRRDHLPDYVVKNFIRAKGIERVLLTIHTAWPEPERPPAFTP